MEAIPFVASVKYQVCINYFVAEYWVSSKTERVNKQFKGTVAMTRGHGGNPLCCICEVSGLYKLFCCRILGVQQDGESEQQIKSCKENNERETTHMVFLWAHLSGYKVCNFVCEVLRHCSSHPLNQLMYFLLENKRKLWWDIVEKEKYSQRFFFLSACSTQRGLPSYFGSLQNEYMISPNLTTQIILLR